MKKILNVLLVIVIAAMTSLATLKYNAQQTVNVPKETAFERVLRTNTLRCGYYVYPPVTMRDPNTGKLSGFSVDMMEYIAERAGMKIEWTEEVNFGNWISALEANRFDAACTPMWPSMALGRAVIFSKPMFFSGIYMIGKAGDTRFPTLSDIDKPGVRISVHDGNDMMEVARIFSNVTLQVLPQNAEGQQPILDIISGKADLMISDKNAIEQWNSKQDDKIAIMGGGKQVKLQAFDLAVKAGEGDLNNFLNNAIDQLQATGKMDKLMEKWMQPGLFMPVAAPNAQQ